MKLKGKELVAGCILKYDNEINFCKVYYVQKDLALISRNFDSAFKTNSTSNYEILNDAWCNEKDIRGLHIHLYPIIGQDENGDDVRMFDEIKTSFGEKAKALFYIPAQGEGLENYFLVANDESGGWRSSHRAFTTLIKQEPEISKQPNIDKICKKFLEAVDKLIAELKEEHNKK